MPTANDEFVEGNETFTMVLGENNTTSLPDRVTIRDGTATGTTTEDDTGQVTLSPATATAAEDGTFTCTVSLRAAAVGLDRHRLQRCLHLPGLHRHGLETGVGQPLCCH